MSKSVLVLVVLLCPLIAAAQKEVTQGWFQFQQSVDASFLKKTVNFKLSAHLKVISPADNSLINISVVVFNKGGGVGSVDSQPLSELIKANEWTQITIEGTMDEKSQKLEIGGYCYGNGKFLFDNFELLVENDKGQLQRALLNNPDFETLFTGDVIPGWTESPLKVKGFTSSVSDDFAHGGHALMIEGKGIQRDSTDIIVPSKGYTPQIGALVAMLNNLSERVERRVKALSQYETDHLLDENANSIGALVMHLAAAEAQFQVFTFEHRLFNKEEVEKWGDALMLGPAARTRFKGKEISYYLEHYRAVRKKTLEELRKYNDDWLYKTEPGADGNNYYYWFHVMEHQSSHLGQILLLKKRLPKPKEKSGEKINLEMN